MLPTGTAGLPGSPRPDAIFSFLFQADSGDSWFGTVVLDADRLAVGERIRTAAGTYLVLDAETPGMDLSVLGLEDEQVFVHAYWDASGSFLPTRAGPGAPVGTAGLGSELDFAWTGAAWERFGRGGLEQANAAAQRADTAYGWTFEAFSGDRWSGTLLGLQGAFAPGAVVETLDGRFRITAAAPLPASSTAPSGTGSFGGLYYDAGQNRLFPFDPALATVPQAVGLMEASALIATPEGLREVGRGGALQVAWSGDQVHLDHGPGWPADRVLTDLDGGSDTLAFRPALGGVRVDLAPGAFSQTPLGGFRIDPRSVIENVVGTDFADTLAGNHAPNVLIPGAGADVLDGRDGFDTLVLAGARADYWTFAWGAQIIVVPRTAAAWQADGLDRARDVEQLVFLGGAERMAVAAAAVRPLDYIASYPDLMNAFGASAAAGFEHLALSGIPNEGRRVTFSGLDYIASYADLAGAFGADADAGARHFILAGRHEGRRVTFDGLDYIASYADLAGAFGADADAGARHFILAGRHEGRGLTFDALAYIASHGDLIVAFGAEPEAGARHYIGTGRAEGRGVTFDALAYVASHADLIGAFGTDAAAATRHYILTGFREGRGVDFDAARYLAKYADLSAFYGTDTAAATRHFILQGFREGRSDDLF